MEQNDHTGMQITGPCNFEIRSHRSISTATFCKHYWSKGEPYLECEEATRQAWSAGNTHDILWTRMMRNGLIESNSNSHGAYWYKTGSLNMPRYQN